VSGRLFVEYATWGKTRFVVPRLPSWKAGTRHRSLRVPQHRIDRDLPSSALHPVLVRTRLRSVSHRRYYSPHPTNTELIHPSVARQVQGHPRNRLGMYAWILGSRFRRMVAGDRGVYANDEEGMIGPAELLSYINWPLRHRRDKSEGESDDWGKRTTYLTWGFSLWDQIVGRSGSVAASGFPGSWEMETIRVTVQI
jgi:hypothetical protein